MPRPKLLEPRVRLEACIPEDLYAKVNLMLLDPVRGARKQGALGDLITALLRKWLQDQGVRI